MGSEITSWGAKLHHGEWNRTKIHHGEWNRTITDGETCVKIHNYLNN